MNYLMHTDRLRLRELQETDARLLFDLNNDLEVVRFTGDHPFANPEAALGIVRYVRSQYVVSGMGRWLVERTDTGEAIGWCGLKKWPDLDQVDLGFRFFRRFWGAGYATEAGEACVRYGFDMLQLPRIIGRVMPANTASVRVLEKLGFTPCGEITEDGELLLIFELNVPGPHQ